MLRKISLGLSIAVVIAISIVSNSISNAKIEPQAVIAPTDARWLFDYLLKEGTPGTRQSLGRSYYMDSSLGCSDVSIDIPEGGRPLGLMFKGLCGTPIKYKGRTLSVHSHVYVAVSVETGKPVGGGTPWISEGSKKYALDEGAFIKILSDVLTAVVAVQKKELASK